jgi:hypothetical protein
MKHSIIVFFLFASICFGQKSKERKITVEDLKQTAHQIDTSAVAAIIDKRSTVKYIYDKSNGFHIVQDIEYVYKIYKKQGLKYADFEIPYYIGYKEINKDRVNIAIAETYNLVDNKIVKSVVKKESTFKTKQNEYWEVLKLSFPNVREGSIFKIKYQLKTFDIGELPDYHFQYSIPVIFLSFTFIKLLKQVCGPLILTQKCQMVVKVLKMNIIAQQVFHLNKLIAIFIWKMCRRLRMNH